MSNWTEGYVSEENYTTGYYKELNPQNLIMPLLMSGIAPPKIENACELGFGMGVSISIHACAGSAKWYGTDFNPSHTLFANYLSEGTACEKYHLANQSFSEFCQRDDLPEFDFIALHGIWSWISNENQDIIVDFLNRKLKVGGILYISYNTLPGWAATSPLQHLVSRSYNALSSSQNTPTQNIQQAVDYAAKIIDKSQSLAKESPTITGYMQHIINASKTKPRYVLHEYLNQHWSPMYFADMEQRMNSAKLSYACSSSYLHDCDFAMFSDDEKQFLDQVSDLSLKQTIKDFLINNRFRRDLWIKGKRTLNSAQLEQAWFKQRVVLIRALDLPPENSYRKPFTLNSEHISAFSPILSDGNIHSVESICQSLPHYDNSAIFSILAILIDAKYLALTQSDECITQVKHDCEKFNQKVFELLFSENALNHVASPVTGGAFNFSPIDLLFTEAIKLNLKESEWAEHVLSRLQKAHQTALKDGHPIDAEELPDEIRKLQILFKENTLKTLTSLGII